MAQKAGNDDLINTLFPSTPNYNFILNALDSSLCIIKQEYTLTGKNGIEYGRNADAFFGKKYALGVITDSGIYTTADILLPWKGDPNFDRFKTSDSLKPTLSKAYYKGINDNTFSMIDSAQFKHKKSYSFVILPIPGTLRGLPATGTKTDTAGWMVMIKSETGAVLNDSTRLNVSVVKQSFSPDTTGSMYIKNPVSKDKLISGIYYTMRIYNGSILFQAAGILNKDEKGWFIKSLHTTVTETKQHDIILNPVSLPLKEKKKTERNNNNTNRK